MDAGLHVTEVPAGRGLGWLRQGFSLFRQQPFGWIGLVGGWLFFSFVLVLLPLIVGVLGSFLHPVFFASFALAAMRQEAGYTVTLADLAAGFRRNLRALISLGVVLMLAEIAVLLMMVFLGLPVAGDGERTVTIAEYVEMLRGKEWILAVGFLLSITVKGALWFAPPLIAFHDMAVTHAIRWSVYAALANIGAMMVYGMGLLALFFVGLVPWGLGLLVAIPMMAVSTYVGYREVFGAKAVAVPDAPAA